MYSRWASLVTISPPFTAFGAWASRSRNLLVTQPTHRHDPSAALSTEKPDPFFSAFFPAAPMPSRLAAARIFGRAAPAILAVVPPLLTPDPAPARALRLFDSSFI